jgi:hypothetical protein
MSNTYTIVRKDGTTEIREYTTTDGARARRKFRKEVARYLKSDIHRLDPLKGAVRLRPRKILRALQRQFHLSAAELRDVFATEAAARREAEREGTP